MRAIILGSGGFISSEVEKILKLKNIKYLGLKRKDINLLKESSSLKLKKLIKKDDIILFIAAIAPAKNIQDLIDNLIILKNACNGIDYKKIKKIVYISSDAVYSDTKKKINEKSETIPNSTHGIMHLLRENYLKNIFTKKLCLIRPTLIYGSNDPHNSYGPNSFIRKYLNNKNISLFGKGEEKRDHVWIEDVANIIVDIIYNNFFGIINIATGKTISFYKIAKIINQLKKQSSRKISFIKRNGPMPHNGLRRFDISLLKKIISKNIPTEFPKVFKKIYLNYR
jgi:nucleoside-diphosphate-sugar epimerase